MRRTSTLEDRICELFSSQVEDEAQRALNIEKAGLLEEQLQEIMPKPARDILAAEYRSLMDSLTRDFERNENGYGDIDPDEPRAPLMVEAVKLKPRLNPTEDGENENPEQIVYVSAYSVDRHCGGSEEGGWWYNWFTHLLSIPCLYRDHKAVIEGLEKGDLEGRNHGDIYSVLGGEEIRYYIEYIPGTQASRVRPRYC